MAQITNCLKLISRMPESDQDALVSRLDELQALGVPAQRAQVQAAIDLMSRLEREANPQGIQRSAARDVTETPEFRSWFGDSKVVDADGKPLVVYHATTSNIKKFSTKKSAGGFYFTPNAEDAYPSKRGEMTSERGLNVMPAYLAINSPLRTSDPADWHRLDADRRSSIEDRGFDGVIVENEDGSVREYIAFEPSQIKSAIGNRGTFDPADPDITRSASRLPAGVEIIEVDDGFDAMQDGKRIGRLRDNLPRGAAERLDENASVDIVKVENEFKGQGVGAALYDAFYEKHGGRIAPSGKTSPEAWALWKRKFPQKVQEFVQAEAQRIRDGADPFMVMRNITDKDVARDVAIAAGDNVIRSVARNVVDSAEFKRWFGDSKVADAEGKPLVVYHGSRYNADIKRFSAAKSEQSAAERGIYFTDSADHADQYASQWGDASPEDGGSIYPVYLKIENPYVSNAWEWNMGTDITPAQARKRGHDGYVIQNHEGGTTYIAFRPEQIKSAIGNRGTFDPSDTDITRSAARPEFFSQLQRSIEQVPDRLATMSAPQWKLWLDANAAKLGVKKDEIEWSTIKDYLTLRGKDKVTRDELAAYLSDSGVRVREVVLGGGGTEKVTLVRDSTRQDAWGEVVVYRSSDGAFVVENGIGGQSWSVQDADSYDSDYSEDDGSYAGSFSSREAVESFINGQTQAADPYYSGVGSNPATKYGAYTVPGGPLSRDTEILTRDGWMRMDEVQIGDEVMTRRDEDGGLEWQPVEALPTVYAEKLYHFKNQSINMRVTPCHKMVVKRRRRSTGEIVRVTAEQLWGMSEMVAPLTGSWGGGEFSDLFDQDPGDVAELLGWFIAEGHYKTEADGKKSTIGIAQCRSANSDKCARIESLLGRMGIAWNYSGGQYWLGVKKMSADLVQLLHAQGKSAEKYVPGFMFNAPASVIQRMLDGLLLGDGCLVKQNGRKPRWTYHTKSKQLADDVQVLALLVGKRGSVSRRKTGLYTVTINDKQWASIDDAKHAVVDYNDIAYCVTVKNHSIYVRTNGVAAFTGNSNYREVLITLPPIGRVRYTEENVVAIDDADDPNRSRYFWRFKVPGNELQISKQVYRTQEEAKAYILSEKQPEPPADKNYRSSHWDALNVIAHIRVDDRVDSDGKKVLFVNELQSDFGQDYRKAKEAIESAVDTDFMGIVERMKKAGVLEVVCD